MQKKSHIFNVEIQLSWIFNRVPTKLFKILKDDTVEVLHSIFQQIWNTQQWPWYWKRSFFIPIPKKDNAKESSSYRTTVLISHASKVIFKILQVRLQQYMNRELQMYKLDLEKERNQRFKCSIHWIIEKAKEFQENIYSCFTDYTEAFDCVDYNKLQKNLKEMGIPDHLNCLLRNLYAGQEGTEWTWNNQGTGQNWERSTTMLYTVILLI